MPGASSTLTFAPVLFLAWAAVRFDLRVASGELALLGIFVTAQTVIGTGPFGDGVDTDRFTALTGGALTQGYLASAALLVLPLGIAIQRNTLLLDRITADGKLFRRNFTESLVGMAFLEPDESGRDLVVVDLNETALGILGGSEESLLGMRITEIMDTGPEYDETLPRLLDGSLDGWRVEGPLIFSRDGQVTLQISALGGDADDAPFFAAQLLDVTAEYDARHGLEAAQTLTNATLDTTNCIIMVTDIEGIVVRVNQATTVITGYTEDELLGRKVWDTGITPSDADDVEAVFMWPNRSGVPIVRESDALTKTGEKLRIVWNTNIVRDDLGNAMYAVMTGIDVTAERTTAGLVNHLMEASLTTAIIGIDTAGRISVANSGLQHLLGYDRDELVGEPFHKLLKSAELLERTGADNLDEAFDILVRGLGRDGETRARDWTWMSKGGGEQLVSMTLSVAQDAFAARTGYLCVARDVTEQRHSQEMLIAALDKERTAVERLRSLDQAKNEFVSTVSHELRTPVTSIVGYTEMLTDGSIVDALPDQLPLLETINRNGQRLISMINDLLMLSGLDSDSVAWRHDPVDLAATVGPIEEAIRPLLNGRHLDLRDRPPGLDGPRARRPRPARAGDDQPALQRGEVHRGRRHRLLLGRHRRRGRARGDHRARHRHRHPHRRAGRAVPAVLPLLHRPGPPDPGHRPRPLDRPGHRRRPRRHHRGRVRAHAGLDVHGAAAAGEVGAAHPRRLTRCSLACARPVPRRRRRAPRARRAGGAGRLPALLRAGRRTPRRGAGPPAHVRRVRAGAGDRRHHQPLGRGGGPVVRGTALAEG